MRHNTDSVFVSCYDGLTVKIVPRIPLTIVLDNVRSAYNVGAVLRTADCVHLAQVVMCGYTPPSSHPKVRKTALDAEKIVRTRHAASLEETLRALSADGVQIFAMERTEQARLLWELPDTVFTQPAALVFGNELDGVQLDVTRAAGAGELALPQFGIKDSLNVATAASITMYHWRYRATSG